MNTITWDKRKMLTHSHTHFYPICPETLVKYEICADTAHICVCSLTFTLFVPFPNVTSWELKVHCDTTCQPASQPDSLVPMYKCICEFESPKVITWTRTEIRFNGNVCAHSLLPCILHICADQVRNNCCSYTHCNRTRKYTLDSFNPFIQLISWNWKCAADNGVRKYTHSNAIRSQGMVCDHHANQSDQWIISCICGFKKWEETNLTACDEYRMFSSLHHFVSHLL